MNRTKRSGISLVIMLALIIILGVSTAYAWFTASVSGSIDFTFSSGNINIQVTSNDVAINSQTFTKSGVMPGDHLLTHDVMANKSEESVSFYFRIEISLDVDDALSDYEPALSNMFTVDKIGSGNDFVQDTSVTDVAVFYYGTADALTEVSTTDQILLLDADNFIIPTTLTQLDEYAQAGKGVTLNVVVVAIQSANMMGTMAAFKSVIAGDAPSGVQYEISADGEYLYFGSYPQTLKADDVTVTTAPDANGYYLGSDGEKYAKLTANFYSDTDTQYQVYNMTNGETYYFKVEPIKWRILSKTDNTYTVVSDVALQGLAYQSNVKEVTNSLTSSTYYYVADDSGNIVTYHDSNAYANNYDLSDLRDFLNNDFYNKAFTSSEQAVIETTTVDNSNASYGGTVSNSYVCDNTTDKIYALSATDLINTSYGFNASINSADTARHWSQSDYAIASGAYMDAFQTTYVWTRTPGNYGNMTKVVGGGQVGDLQSVDNTIGVAPAMVVTLTPQSSGTVTEGEIFTENGKQYMYFGEYPQTLKADNVTVGTTADSKGYYTGSDGAKYVKQTAQYDTNWFDTEEEWTTEWAGNVAKDGRVMTLGQDYYFKVEPIKWRILSSSNGTYTIVCDSILSGLAYQSNYDDDYNVLDYYNGNAVLEDVELNNYKYSTLRYWLNNTFYNSAFTSSQQSSILTTTVDNSASQYTSDVGVDADNEYLCENTSDKVYALSVADVCNESYGFSTKYDEQDTARYWGTTDYARATGAATITEAYLTNNGITEGSSNWDVYSPYIGSGVMWLRSPYPTGSLYAFDVDYGYADGYGGVYDASFGVAPALQISL